MRITQERGLRDFWYPVIPLDNLRSGPQPFTLLGVRLVLWLDEIGRPAAALDRCCHRWALLSKGWVEKGNVVCPYHGWAYAKNGKCVSLPQQPHKKISESIGIPAFHCDEKFGYVWVCLGTPRLDIVRVPEASDPSYRFFPCFYEVWNTSSQRVVENELDMAHFAVIHRGTFGDPATPNPLTQEIEELDAYSIRVVADLSVRPPEQQRKNTAEKMEVSTRRMDVVWTAPFCIRLGLFYPSGLHHVILNYPTPISDNQIQVVQFCFRNDTEERVSQKEILAFERLILNEDRAVLEFTEPDVPLEPTEAMHLVTDKPALLVRKKLSKILHPKQKSQRAATTPSRINA